MLQASIESRLVKTYRKAPAMEIPAIDRVLLKI
jgi:hypothetical protein